MRTKTILGITLSLLFSQHSYAFTSPPDIMVPATLGGNLPPSYNNKPGAPIVLKIPTPNAPAVTLAPVLLQAQPIQIQPVVIEAQPIQVQPVVIQAQPIVIQAKPVVIQAQPVIIQAPPVLVQAQPVVPPPTPNYATMGPVQPLPAQPGPNGQGTIPGKIPTQSFQDGVMNDSFMEALRGIMPITPLGIRKTKEEADKRAYESVRPVTMPTPGTRSITLSLRPGEALPVLHTFPGNATTLTFADRTGAAWPVLSVTVGNKDAYNVQQIGDKGTSNMVVVSPLQQFAFANNMVVTLVGNPMPIIFMLETGGNKVDFRVDIGLRSRGPNAVIEPAGFSALAPTNDSVMQGFVDGTPPQGAKRMNSSRSDVEAWRVGDMLYIRTALDMQSPTPVSSAMHVSGVKVYGIIYTPVLILSQNGVLVRANIDDRAARGAQK